MKTYFNIAIQFLCPLSHIAFFISLQTEAIYLPYCKDVKPELLKEKLEDFLPVVERKTGMKLKFYIDESHRARHHFIIK